MKAEQHKYLIDWYHQYVKNFVVDGVLPEMIALKYQHSQEVAKVARTIAEKEKFADGDILLAEIIGLYHDIGRYPQYKNFHTFQDHRSVNHGECGANVMRETNCLQQLDNDEQQIAIVAVQYHNARVIPNYLPPRQKTLLNLVRDSDKIDIYRVHHQNYTEKIYQRHPEIFHEVHDDLPVSAAVLKLAQQHQPIHYAQVRSMADFLVITLQWFYDFNFRASYQILRERKALDMLISIIHPTPALVQLYATTRAHIDEQCAD